MQETEPDGHGHATGASLLGREYDPDLLLDDLLAQLKPLTNDLSYLPSYWLAREERRQVLVALTTSLPEETAACWHDVVRWCNLQPASWWLRIRLEGHAPQRVLHEVRMLQALRKRHAERGDDTWPLDFSKVGI